MKKLNVAILGATGAVGQRFIQLLENHPWFEVTELIGSERSAGKKYGDAANWVLDGAPPTTIREKIVKGLYDPIDAPLVFSALPKEPAVEREPDLANAGHIVCTNASAHRMADDVPLLLPEVNADHIGLISVQRENRHWGTGALIANSNCTVMPVVMALKPLMSFGIKHVHMVSQQAISGAGHPGVSSLDIMDNVIPYIGGEEEKTENESRKMLGGFTGESIAHAEFLASATCTRVPVIDGHLVTISVGFESKVGQKDILHAWESFIAPNPVPSLPSAPAQMVAYLPQADRPQSRRDRMAGNGMTTSVGRLRECPILGYKFVALSHNTIRGAAGCSILNAELLAVEGYFNHFNPIG
jgi:aspartate-semialdehyde dehydrogenase